MRSCKTYINWSNLTFIGLPKNVVPITFLRVILDNTSRECSKLTEMRKKVFELFSHHFLKGFSLTPSDALDTGHSWFTESHSEVEYLLKVEVKNQNSSGVILNMFFQGF